MGRGGGASQVSHPLVRKKEEREGGQKVRKGGHKRYQFLRRALSPLVLVIQKGWFNQFPSLFLVGGGGGDESFTLY